MFQLLIGVVINEVMYDPRGPESSAGLYNEAVEVFNEGDTTVCLTGWRIGDTHDLDPIGPFPDSAVLSSCPGCVLDVCIPPGGFGVVLDRDYTNPSSPDPMPYPFPSGTVLMSVSDASIGNGLSQGDSLFLVSSAGDTVDGVGNFPETGDGVSAERRAPNMNSFLPSRSPSGNTLGYGNSITCPYEASVRAISVLTVGEEYRALFVVRNGGVEARDFNLTLYRNSSPDSSITVSLSPDSTDTLTFRFGPDYVGTNEVSLKLDSSDCFPEDNFAFLHFVVGRPSLVINEINYRGTEWFEVYNSGEWPLHFPGMVVGDATGRSDTFSLTVGSGEYAVLTGDSAFSERFPGVPFTYVARMPRLNDTYDDLLLSDGTTLDSLRYFRSWGGGEDRSLERVSPFLPSTDSTNWITCRDPSGGTPGRENSVSTAPPSEGVRLGREIYSPGESVSVAFSYPFRVERLKVVLYDDLGRKVREWEFRPNSPVGQVAFSTEGLWRGLYFVSVEAVGKGRRTRQRLRMAVR